MQYFDNAATSWPKPEVVYQAHDKAFRRGGSAGRGVNQASLWAGREIYQTRKALATLFNIRDASRIIFTYNVTEALNVGLQGLLQSGDHVLISSLEHNAVLRPLEFLKARGITYTLVPCSQEGQLETADLEQLLRKETKMVCITHASNVLGTLQPLKELGAFSQRHGLIFMVDAAQSAGIIPLDVEEMNIDFLAFTGHKGLLGPQGTGGYYIRKGLTMKPLIFGGTGINSADYNQPQSWPEGYESGTRNVPGLVSLRAGIEFLLEQGISYWREKEMYLMKKLMSGLQDIKGCRILGPLDINERVGLVSCNFADIPSDNITAILDSEFGIITRSGLHCAPLAHGVAGTLERGAIRLSLGVFHGESDINILLNTLTKVVKELG